MPHKTAETDQKLRVQVADLIEEYNPQEDPLPVAAKIIALVRTRTLKEIQQYVRENLE